MAHSSSKNTTDQLAKIGKETFDAIGSKQLVFHYHQYQTHQAKANHVVQQQVYYTARMTERVITSDEAARMYGGSINLKELKVQSVRLLNISELLTKRELRGRES
ncbi:hypothetical protein R6Q57_012439 [Mikania cordata]